MSLRKFYKTILVSYVVQGLTALAMHNPLGVDAPKLELLANYAKYADSSAAQDVRDIPGKALITAAQRGDARAIVSFLVAGAPADVKDACEMTPLMRYILDGSGAALENSFRPLIHTKTMTQAHYKEYKEREESFVIALAHLMMAGCITNGPLETRRIKYDKKDGRRTPIHLNDSYMNGRIQVKLGERTFSVSTHDIFHYAGMNYLKDRVEEKLSLSLLAPEQQGIYLAKLDELKNKKRALDDEDRPHVDESEFKRPRRLMRKVEK